MGGREDGKLAQTSQPVYKLASTAILFGYSHDIAQNRMQPGVAYLRKVVDSTQSTSQRVDSKPRLYLNAKLVANAW